MAVSMDTLAPFVVTYSGIMDSIVSGAKSVSSIGLPTVRLRFRRIWKQDIGKLKSDEKHTHLLDASEVLQIVAEVGAVVHLGQNCIYRTWFAGTALRLKNRRRCDALRKSTMLI